MIWFGGVGLAEQHEIEEVLGAPSLATREAVGTYTRLDLDMGLLLDHLSNMLWTTRVDVLASRYGFNGVRDPLRMGSIHWTVPVMTQMSLNVSRMLSVTWGFALRNDTQVGAGTTQGYMYEILRFVPRSRFGIEMGAEQGRYARLWVGLRWQVAGAAAAETLVRGGIEE